MRAKRKGEPLQDPPTNPEVKEAFNQEEGASPLLPAARIVDSLCLAASLCHKAFGACSEELIIMGSGDTSGTVP